MLKYLCTNQRDQYLLFTNTLYLNIYAFCYTIDTFWVCFKIITKFKFYMPYVVSTVETSTFFFLNLAVIPTKIFTFCLQIIFIYFLHLTLHFYTHLNAILLHTTIYTTKSTLLKSSMTDFNQIMNIIHWNSGNFSNTC